VRVLPWLTAGTEAAWRWIDTPVISDVSADTDERELRFYLDAILGDQVTATLAVANERADSDHPIELDHFEFTEFRGDLSWFHPSGFFASGGAGYVWHEFDGFGRSGDDRFPIANLLLGYRLPNERGVISLELQNAFDTTIEFEDRPVQTLLAPVSDPHFARDFTAIGRVMLKF